MGLGAILDWVKLDNDEDKNGRDMLGNGLERNC